MNALTVPIIFDHAGYISYSPPALGDRVRWQLFWNDTFAHWWPQLRPGWSLTVPLSEAAIEAHVGPESDEGTAMQSR